MDKKELGRLVDIDFPVLKIIDRETIENSVIASQRGYHSDVRIATGMVFTTKEFEEYRKRVLSMDIP